MACLYVNSKWIWLIKSDTLRSFQFCSINFYFYNSSYYILLIIPLQNLIFWLISMSTRLEMALGIRFREMVEIIQKNIDFEFIKYFFFRTISCNFNFNFRCTWSTLNFDLRHAKCNEFFRLGLVLHDCWRCFFLSKSSITSFNMDVQVNS